MLLLLLLPRLMMRLLLSKKAPAGLAGALVYFFSSTLFWAQPILSFHFQHDVDPNGEHIGIVLHHYGIRREPHGQAAS